MNHTGDISRELCGNRTYVRVTVDELNLLAEIFATRGINQCFKGYMCPCSLDLIVIDNKRVNRISVME